MKMILDKEIRTKHKELFLKNKQQELLVIKNEIENELLNSMKVQYSERLTNNISKLQEEIYSSLLIEIKNNLQKENNLKITLEIEKVNAKIENEYNLKLKEVKKIQTKC